MTYILTIIIAVCLTILAQKVIVRKKNDGVLVITEDHYELHITSDLDKLLNEGSMTILVEKNSRE